MRPALVCRECGRPITSASASPLAGCPYCLVKHALSDVESPSSVASSHGHAPPGSPQGEQVPGEVTQTEASARLGKYVRVAKLGSGGMGDVWKAWDSELERWVALKLLRHDDSREVERFTREARTAAALSHPGIAAVHEAGAIDGKPFIAMQLIEGRTLAEWPRSDRRRLVALVRDAARAVGFAHRHGIIHRDLKPTNLMASETEPEPRVVVMDFGLARRIHGAAKLSRTGTLAGTPHYMSPEQASGRRVDARSDLYSLGATLYELLSGRTPFPSSDPAELLQRIAEAEPTALRTLDRTIPRDLETIVFKCLEKDPSRRYESAQDLAGDLDRWLSGKLILARPASLLYRFVKAVSRRKAMAAAFLVAGVAVSLAGWWSVAGSRETGYAREFASAMKLWAEALRAAKGGRDPAGIPQRASKAREAFERALRVHETPEALLMTGKCLELEGRADEGLKALELAHRADTTDAEARIELAKALLLKYQKSRGLPFRSPTYSKSDERKYLSHELPPETDEQRRWRERGTGLLTLISAPPEQKSLMMALISMGGGDHAAAAGYFAEYSKVERWDIQAWSLQGVCRQYSNELTEAIACLDESLGRNAHLEDFNRRATLKSWLGLHDEAIADFDRALALDSKSVGTWLGRGMVHFFKGQPATAMEDFDRALELDPNHPRVYLCRGYVLQNQGHHDAAIQNLRKSIKLDKNLVDAYYQLGIARAAKGQYEAAIEDYTTALKLRPQLSIAYYARGNSRKALDQLDPALADYDEAIRLDPGHSWAYCNRGLAREAKGLIDGAKYDFIMAIQLDPKNRAAHVNLGNVKYLQGKFDEAIGHFSTAFQVDPNYIDALFYCGMAREKRGLTDEALRDYGEAIRLDSKNAKYRFARGQLRFAKGDLENALVDFRAAFDLDPKDAEACANVGNLLKSLGRHDEAIPYLEKAIDMNPRMRSPRLARGWILESRGRVDEAEADYLKALELSATGSQREEAQRHLDSVRVARPFFAGVELIKKMNYRGAIEKFEEVTRLVPKTEQGGVAAANIAMCYALLKDKTAALEWLGKAIEWEWKDASAIEKNPSFALLRDEPRFKALLSALKAR